VVRVDIKIQTKTKTDMLQEVPKTDQNFGLELLKQWLNNGGMNNARSNTK